MINVIIPMAGFGKRFSDAGYDKPKPLIQVKGKYGTSAPMIERVIRNINPCSSHLMWYILNGKENNDEIKRLIKSFTHQTHNRFLYTDGPTEGSAITALFAKDEIDYNGELVITNCDQITHDLDLSFLSEFAEKNNADGVLGSFISTSPKNSYMLLDNNGCVEQVKEKIVISNLATNGLHYWRKGKDFIDSANKMIEANERYNNEFYVAPSYNYMIKDGKKVLPFFFNMHYPIGTPEDLKKYEDSQVR